MGRVERNPMEKKDTKIAHKLNNLISLYSALFLTSEASSMFLYAVFKETYICVV